MLKARHLCQWYCYELGYFLSTLGGALILSWVTRTTKCYPRYPMWLILSFSDLYWSHRANHLDEDWAPQASTWGFYSTWQRPLSRQQEYAKLSFLPFWSRIWSSPQALKPSRGPTQPHFAGLAGQSKPKSLRVYWISVSFSWRLWWTFSFDGSLREH